MTPPKQGVIKTMTPGAQRNFLSFLRWFCAGFCGIIIAAFFCTTFVPLLHLYSLCSLFVRHSFLGVRSGFVSFLSARHVRLYMPVCSITRPPEDADAGGYIFLAFLGPHKSRYTMLLFRVCKIGKCAHTAKNILSKFKHGVSNHTDRKPCRRSPYCEKVSTIFNL